MNDKRLYTLMVIACTALVVTSVIKLFDDPAPPATQPTVIPCPPNPTSS